MNLERSVEDVIETLSNAKRLGTQCSLLIGAGCSVDAGIPAAAGIVREIEKHHARSYARADPKTYPNCMAQLARGERKLLIAHYVDRAKVNWAHVGIAALIHYGFVDRVLTTNFDPLVMRACAMMGEFPAVYDFAASQNFQPADVADKSVFHLHGQRSGFVLLHTEQEVIQHKESLRPVFEDAGQGRLWIVVGYSGENDPVFDLLAEQPHFDHKLFWVGFRDNPAPPHVRERLLTGDKYAFFVPGHTADSFFVELTRGLDIFPPDLIARPFTHVARVIETLTPFVISPSYSGPDVLESARGRIREAIDTLEAEATTEGGAATRATALLMEGKYAEVLALHASIGPGVRELDRTAAWAHVERAIDLAQRSADEPPTVREESLRTAIQHTEAAVQLDPTFSGGLTNQGALLALLAELKTGADAEGLVTEAIAKYRAAVEIEPENFTAYNNWGNALSSLARGKDASEAERLLNEAAEKFAAAVDFNPGMYEAHTNWGLALAELARRKTGPDAERMFSAAVERYRAALEAHPEHRPALYNIGSGLIELYHLTGEKNPALLDEAEKHLVALAAKDPGIAAYNLACIYAQWGDDARCRRWLETSLAGGHLPPADHLMRDADLESVREQPWFSELVQQSRPETAGAEPGPDTTGET